jgi:CrcB protein
MSGIDWIVAGLLGGVGAFARFFVDGVVSTRTARAREFPYGTLVVNLSGAIVLGLLSGIALSPREATLWGTATVGAYTTFSTWMLETHRLQEEGELASAYANVWISLLAGLGAAALGRTLGHHL